MRLKVSEKHKAALVDPLKLASVQETPPPVALKRGCPACGQTMVRAFSSGKRVLYCEKDGTTFPEEHFDPSGKTGI